VQGKGWKVLACFKQAVIIIYIDIYRCLLFRRVSLLGPDGSRLNRPLENIETHGKQAPSGPGIGWFDTRHARGHWGRGNFPKKLLKFLRGGEIANHQKPGRRPEGGGAGVVVAGGHSQGGWHLKGSRGFWFGRSWH
jgi:hypothetical protein